MESIEYLVPDWVRARRETFGLLFYDTRTTRLTFVRSADALTPPPFTGGDRRLRMAGRARTEASVARLLEGLVAKGLLVSSEGEARRGEPARPAGARPVPTYPVLTRPVPTQPVPTHAVPTHLAPARRLLAASGERPERLSDSALKSPVNVTWEITRVCNLQCAHCLSADLRSRPSQELDFAACRQLIDELARMEVFQVNFGGGEPFLREDFLEILAHCHTRGLTTCVSTNGTVLTEDLVDRLLALSAPVYLQVSLDGARAETNDALRGPGTFERILRGVELLASRGYPEFSLNMVVTRLNEAELGEFDRLAKRYGAKTRLSRFRPSGAGCGAWQDLHLTREQLLALSRFLGEHPEILTGDSFFALTPGERRNLGLTRCGAAKMTCAVAPDGSVYPCAFLSDPAFVAGKMPEESLAGIFADSPVFRRLRNLEAAACRGCDRFSVCHGGCPAVAYFLTESTSAPDPECLRAFSPLSPSSREVC